MGRVLASAAFALVAGCALFQDLDSSPYQQVEAGPFCADGGDGGCVTGEIVCSPSCATGDVCCVEGTASGAFAFACKAPSECGAAINLSFPLCSGASDCPDGGSCLAQTCMSGRQAITVRACVMIPTCVGQ